MRTFTLLILAVTAASQVLATPQARISSQFHPSLSLRAQAHAGITPDEWFLRAQYGRDLNMFEARGHSKSGPTGNPTSPGSGGTGVGSCGGGGTPIGPAHRREIVEARYGGMNPLEARHHSKGGGGCQGGNDPIAHNSHVKMEARETLFDAAQYRNPDPRIIDNVPHLPHDRREGLETRETLFKLYAAQHRKPDPRVINDVPHLPHGRRGRLDARMAIGHASWAGSHSPAESFTRLHAATMSQQHRRQLEFLMNFL